ncbi:MAG: ATP-binding cassette domain-containing protein, partial [Actinomycetota bacterium]|nr:ATP-binding cassette domain-containing protein [Actinomycetota bacterium]
MTLHADVLVRRGAFTLDVDITAAPGQVLGVLGPNGAGKSTLLRVLAGLEPISAGTVRLGERVLDDPGGGVFLPASRRPVGIVFQDYRLFPHLSALDNVAFGLRAAGVARPVAREKAGALLARLGL